MVDRPWPRQKLSNLAVRNVPLAEGMKIYLIAGRAMISCIKAWYSHEISLRTILHGFVWYEMHIRGRGFHVALLTCAQ